MLVSELLIDLYLCLLYAKAIPCFHMHGEGCLSMQGGTPGAMHTSLVISKTCMRRKLWITWCREALIRKLLMSCTRPVALTLSCHACQNPCVTSCLSQAGHNHIYDKHFLPSVASLSLKACVVAAGAIHASLWSCHQQGLTSILQCCRSLMGCFRDWRSV